MDRTVSTKELQAKLQGNKVKLVETLAPDRYQQGHIPGALNIPPEKIKELAPKILPSKDSEIVTYCSNTH